MAIRETVERIDTPSGVARATVALAAPRNRRERARVFLGHGAGGGIDTPDLLAIRDLLTSRGVAIVRVEQPYRVAGGRMETRTAILDDAFSAVVRALRSAAPTFVGGRSTGARIACRTARNLEAHGVIALAFPLLPKPTRDGTVKSRMPELREAGVSTLVLQGDRDPFGGPSAFTEGGPLPVGTSLVCVPGADHSLVAPGRDGGRARSLTLVAETVLGFVDRVTEHRGGSG